MISFFTTPLFYGIYISMMIAIFFFALYKVLIPYRRTKEEVKILNEFLSEIKQNESNLQKANSLKEWLSNAEQGKFIKNFVLPSFEAFHYKLVDNQKNGILLIPDVYDYFLEDQLMQKFGKRKLVEAIPGLFLALGIIGTFLGIAVGVSELDPGGNSESMRNGITILLSGMKVKFLSSMVGISLSVMWQFIDKMGYYPKLSDSFFEVRQELDRVFPTQEQNTVLYQMLSNQEKQMLDFQSFITEMMIPNMVTGLTQSIQQTIAPQMEQTQNMVKEMLNNSRETQLEGIGVMADKFISSLNEITGDHMKNLGDALSTTIEWQQKVQEEMSSLVEAMENKAREQTLMAEKTISLTQEIQKHTDKFIGFETVMEKNISLLNETLDNNNKLHSNVTNLLERLVEERNTFSQYFDKQNETMERQVSTFVEQTEKQLDLNTKLERNLENIDSISVSHEQQLDSFIKTLDLLNRSNEELLNIVDTLKLNGEAQSNLQKEINASMDIVLKEKTDVGNVVTNLNNQLISQLADMDERISHLSEVWEATSNAFTTANKHLATSMNQFTDDMHRGLEYTFKQFDEELSKSVGYLAKAVHAIHEGVIDLPDSIQVLNTSVGELNKHAKKMVTTIGE